MLGKRSIKDINNSKYSFGIDILKFSDFTRDNRTRANHFVPIVEDGIILNV